jgi:hypothetical protein
MSYKLRLFARPNRNVTWSKVIVDLVQMFLEKGTFTK